MTNNQLNYSSKQPKQSGKERIIGLDFLRIFLALLIFLFHSRIHLDCDYGFLNTFIRNGHLVAMTAFFMLSGYSLVISNGRRNFQENSEIWSFYKKRFISIYPLYFVAGYLGVLLCVVAGSQTISDNLFLLPIELLCIQSFFDTLFPYAHNSGTWFISCLCFCYILFPFLLKLINKVNKRRMVMLLIGLIMLLSYAPYITQRFETAGLYSNPFFRALEFFAGMTLATINLNGEYDGGRIIQFLRNKYLCLLSLLVLIVGISFFATHKYYLSWMPIFFISIILFSAGEPRKSIFSNNKFLLYLSALCYAFFLGQSFVWEAFTYIVRHLWLNPSNLLLIVVSLGCCFVSAICLHEFIEKPSAKWLKKHLNV